MLWSIDSRQNRVSADQYHLTVSWAQVPTHRGWVFFEVTRWQVTSFQMIARLIFLKKIHMKYVVFMCRTINILILNGPRTRNFSELLRAVKTVTFDFSRHGHALVTLYVQFLCSDWSKFDRWVHEKIYTASWKLFALTAEADRALSTCDVFNCLFPLDVQNEIQLLSRVFCYSWLVCLLVFWLRNTLLVKVGNPISDGIVLVFHLAWCLRGLKSLKRF